MGLVTQLFIFYTRALNSLPVLGWIWTVGQCSGQIKPRAAGCSSSRGTDWLQFMLRAIHSIPKLVAVAISMCCMLRLWLQHRTHSSDGGGNHGSGMEHGASTAWSSSGTKHAVVAWNKLLAQAPAPASSTGHAELVSALSLLQGMQWQWHRTRGMQWWCTAHGGSSSGLQGWWQRS